MAKIKTIFLISSVLMLLGSYCSGNSGDLPDTTETETFSDCGDKPCDPATTSVTNCSEQAKLLRSAWTARGLLGVPTWEPGEHKYRRLLLKDGKYTIDTSAPKDVTFGVGAPIDLLHTDLSLEVQSIHSVYSGATDGYQKAVWLKDPQASDYYLTIKTSYAPTENPIWSSGQFNYIWRTQGLVPYVTPVEAGKKAVENVEVTEAFNVYSNMLFDDFAELPVKVADTTLDIIAADTNPNKRIIISGHSLSAAMAQIIALNLSYYFNNSINIVVIAVASPRAGNEGFAHALNDRKISTLRYAFFDKGGNTIAENVDPITCFPTFEAGYRNPGALKLVAADAFELPVAKNPYDRCNVAVSLLSPVAGLQQLIGFVTQHLPAAYDARYLKIQESYNKSCSN